MTVSDRSYHLLKALIQHYIRQGQPVGSKTLAEEASLALSPATIRNALADLENSGFLQSPHTSAGRIPTIQGYRFFVNSLLTHPCGEAFDISQFKEHFNPDSGIDEILQSASQLLSGISQLAGVVTLPKRKQNTLRHVEFLPLSESRVLVILVMNGREVENRIIHIDKKFTPDELHRMSNYINQNFSGQELDQIRRQLLGSLQQDRDDIDELTKKTMRLAEQALVCKQKEDSYVIAGQSNLIDSVNEYEIEKLRGLFEAFSHKHEILQLLDKCLHAHEVQIFIGAEAGYDAFDMCSIVTAPYEINGEIIGALGVIGPTRMDYQRAISVVSTTAKLLNSVLKEIN